MNKYLEELIKTTDLPIMFDYDGVMFEARWYKDRINMRNETEEKLLDAHKKGENLFTTPIPFVKDLISKLGMSDPGRVFVLSHTHDTIEAEVKRAQIQKYYPCIYDKNVYLVIDIKSKYRFLTDMRIKFGGFIYIDDRHDVLIDMENTFDDECKFFHVSSLFV